jgi:flagellin
MRIQTNVAAMNALNNLNITETQQNRSIEKLSSGFRLNRSADDAAGMSIANSLRSNVRGLEQAQRNASQAGSVLQIADGAVQTVSTILDRMKELAVEGSSSNVTDTDRTKIDQEYQQLMQEVDRIVTNTTYQGATLLNGSYGVSRSGGTAAGLTSVNVGGAQASTTYTITATTSTITLSSGTGAGAVSQTIAVPSGATSASSVSSFNFDKLGISFSVTGDIATNAYDGGTIVTGAAAGATFRVGSGGSSDNTISFTLNDLRTSALGLTGTDMTSAANATTVLNALNGTAIDAVNTAIGTIGAAQNRLDYATANVNSLYQNTAAAESVIRDADMAQEYTNYSKLQILQQAGTAMLAQANSSSQSILTLLRG